MTGMSVKSIKNEYSLCDAHEERLRYLEVVAKDGVQAIAKGEADRENIGRNENSIVKIYKKLDEMPDNITKALKEYVREYMGIQVKVVAVGFILTIVSVIGVQVVRMIFK